MRKKVMAVVVAVLAFSLIAASAATLGGITTGDLGSDTTLVASCDTDGVNASFTHSFNGTAYEVDSVTIDGIADTCFDANAQVTVTLANGAGTVSVEVGPGNITDNGVGDNDEVTFAVADGALTVEQLRRVAVVIG